MTLNPDIYSFSLPWTAWALLGLTGLCMIVIAWVWWGRFRYVSGCVKRDDSRSPLPDDAPYPSASVVVYTRGDGQNLRTLLPQILNQDYPAPMEVVVVNDTANDATAEIVAHLERQYPNLYMTFLPERSRNLSRRKLSITLGIKAARYDVVLLTRGNCRVESDQWMRRMLGHLTNPRKEVVIGFALPWGDDEPDHDIKLRRRAFDDQWAAARYLSAALHHKPYMADGYNLAYRRQVFFNNKGFSRALNLNYGDDDIFIRDIVTHSNTAVELSHQGRVRADEFSPAERHDTYRCRRDFTARYLPRAPYRAGALSSWAWWIAFMAGICSIVLAWPSLATASILTGMWLIFGLLHQWIYRRCATALGLRRLFWTVPWLSLTRPLRTLRHRIHGRSQRGSQMTLSCRNVG